LWSYFCPTEIRGKILPGQRSFSTKSGVAYSRRGDSSAAQPSDNPACGPTLAASRRPLWSHFWRASPTLTSSEVCVFSGTFPSWMCGSTKPRFSLLSISLNSLRTDSAAPRRGLQGSKRHGFYSRNRWGASHNHDVSTLHYYERGPAGHETREYCGVRIRREFGVALRGSPYVVLPNRE
jgi:hypothetical protein